MRSTKSITISPPTKQLETAEHLAKKQDTPFYDGLRRP
jgi:hypothetical protein